MSETLSLVPGSLIQFHTIPLNLSRLRKKLEKYSFWMRYNPEKSTPTEKITDLIPLKKTEDGDYWEWVEPVKGQLGTNQHKTIPATGFRSGLTAEGTPVISYKDLEDREEVLTVSFKEIREICADQWVPLPWLAHWEDKGNAEYHNYPSNWVRGCLRVDESGENCHLELAFDTSIDLTSTDNNPRGTQGLMMPTLADVRDDTVFGLPSQPEMLRNWLTLEENLWVKEWMSDLVDAQHTRMLAGNPPKELSVKEKEKRNFEAASLWMALALAVSSNRDVLKDGPTSENGLIPKAQFVKLDRTPPIEVDLVLDLGNFRSCGILIEQKPDRSENSSNAGLENCSLLELRDLKRPSCSYRGIFPSRIEFAKASFGLDNRSRGSGRSGAFFWPGQVRVGQQAERLMTSKRGTEGHSGLATPKRYLWSRQPWKYGWYFNTAEDNPIPSGDQPVSGRFRKPLRELLTTHENWSNTGRWEPEDLPTSLDYSKSTLGYESDNFELESTQSSGVCVLSRSQLFVLMVEELVLHALRFMNDPLQRKKRSMEHTARHLRSVVFTMPPGMALAERRIFLERVKAGVCFAWQQAEQDKLWQTAGWSKPDAYTTDDINPLSRPPQVECDLDEATATQLVWLENEIVTRMGGSVEEFFGLYGHKRTVVERILSQTKGQETQRKVVKETVRVASLDIGGGTTDMMVATYARENSEALTPTQNFRESFQLAGDNLLEKITTEIVLKQSVAPALAAVGVPKPLSLLQEIFKPSRTDVRNDIVRHLLVSILLEPAALKVLEIYEGVKPYENGVIGQFTLAASENLANTGNKATQWERCASLLRLFLKAHYEKQKIAPSAEMAAFLDPQPQEEIYADQTLSDENPTPVARPIPFDLRIAVVQVDAREVDKCIQSALGQTLQQFCAAIRAYGCDILLLSGRPSKLRHVTDIIVSQLPVMPQRIICMHNYTINRNYPFSNADGKIEDPKTTVVCGAAIWKLAAQKRLLNFTLRTEELKMKSTVNYIGEMQVGAGTLKKALNTQPLDLETPAKDKPFATEITSERDQEIKNIINEDAGQIIKVTCFENEMHLGWRQLPNPSWTATPLYRISFRPGKTGVLPSKNLNGSYSLFLKQAESSLKPEDLVGLTRAEVLEKKKKAALQQEDLVLCALLSEKGPSKEIIGPKELNEILEIQLMTTLEMQGHWRDTGCLTIPNEI